MAYAVKVLRDSLSPDGVRLTTMEVTFPRIVLAEFNTHRMFSRNSASSRAIPVKKMLEKVSNDPFVPVYWGKNQKGMQASEELSPDEQVAALHQWLAARDEAIARVEELQLIDVHKQIANRLLEPWLWHTVIVTATEWDNFWGLRCSKDAQPEIRRIAEMMRELYDAGKPTTLGLHDWHLPLVDDFYTLQTSGYSLQDIVKVCVGRCTRVSYLTHDGKRDPQADIDLCERLLKSGHMSPFEHAARPMNNWECEEKYGHKGQYVGDHFDPSKNFCGNFRGWIQARKEIRDEDDFSRVSRA